MSLKWRFALLAVLAMTLLCGAIAARADVIITEIMADNGEFDNNGNAYDWIEICNSGSKAVDISGWGLTDTSTDLYAFRFPSGTKLGENEYALIYCCGDDTGNADRPKNRTYYAPFKLSSSGETIRLTDKDGGEINVLKYPAQLGGVSWGRANGKDEFGFFAEATPRKKNASKICETMADMPVIDLPAGFYDKAVSVTITSSVPVHYTLDGSIPTEKSRLYSGPITVQKTSVVRARAFADGQVPSYIATASYIIKDPAITPVISFSTNRDNLYGGKGLFVTGKGSRPNFYMNWEYPIHMEYFDENGVRQINQMGSFHIVGSSTRSQKQKSFAVYARTAYGGDSRFNYNPFDDRDYTSYKSFTIRSTASDQPYCRMKDLVFTRLANGLDIMHAAGKTVVVYINGEYYGHCNIREKINKYSIAQWEGVTDKDDIDKITIIKGEARDDQIQNGSPDEWRAFRAYVRTHDLNVPEYFAYVDEQLDIDSLLTWTSYQICMMNPDLENVRVYRVPGGKWRYVLYDTESGGEINNLAVYMLLNADKAGPRISSHYSLINNLLKVPEVRLRFLQKLAEVMEHSFLYTSVLPEIERNEALLKQILPRHFTVYSNNNYQSWRSNVQYFKNCMRMLPRKVLALVFDLVHVTPQEQETYFRHVQDLLAVTNAKEAQ